VSSPTHPLTKGWQVALAAFGINLALGVLYSWSIVSKNIPAEWHWSEAERSLPYSVACLVFSLMMVPAGRLQDKISPGLVAMSGGVLVGLGLIVSSWSTTPMGYILGFGLLAGTGFGFAYASTTPPAVKWFPASKTGIIAGLVVAGFGLSSVYVAPLAEYLIHLHGLPFTMMAFGLGFMTAIVALSRFLKIPPAGYLPSPGLGTGTTASTASVNIDQTPMQVLQSGQFYLLWFLFACCAGAGLMIISKLAKMVDLQTGMKLGFLLVACLAVGNGVGRILGGWLSDQIGRARTLFLSSLAQAVCILLLSQAHQGNLLASTPVLILISTLIGANYGANLALFPSLAKDLYGLNNFGMNYGLLFTAWGIGGFGLSLLAGHVYDTTKSFSFAYETASILLVIAALMSFFIAKPASTKT
jgi:OFA family oxalate/formate antiporter-like MFS transporter